MSLLVIGGRLTRADAPALCERACRMLAGGETTVLVCDVGAVVDVDLATVDALLRLQLAARRRGAEIRLARAPRELLELLELAGLASVLA